MFPFDDVIMISVVIDGQITTCWIAHLFKTTFRLIQVFNSPICHKHSLDPFLYLCRWELIGNQAHFMEFYPRHREQKPFNHSLLCFSPSLWLEQASQQHISLKYFLSCFFLIHWTINTIYGHFIAANVCTWYHSCVVVPFTQYFAVIIQTEVGWMQK